jgi:hypothetical protein
MQGSLEEAEKYFDGERNYHVSAHYGVARDGRVWQFVKDEDTAWANGVIQQPDASLDWLKEALAEKANINLLTIAIEYEGRSGEPFPEAQYEAMLVLHRRLLEKWDIPADRQHLIGHEQLDSLERSGDPGPSFPWARLLQDLNRTEPFIHTETIFEAPTDEAPEPFVLLQGEKALEEKPTLFNQSFEEPPPFDLEPVSINEAPSMPTFELPSSWEMPVDLSIENTRASADPTLNIAETSTGSGFELEHGLPLELELEDAPPIEPEPEISTPESLPDKLGGTTIIWSSIGGGIVKVELANLRERPSLDPSTIMRTATKGTRLHFDGFSDGPELFESTIWLHISREDGYGWIHSSLVQLDKPAVF